MKKHILKLRYLFTRKEKIQIIFLTIALVIGSFLEILGLGAVPLLVMAIADPTKLFNNEIAGPVLQYLNVVTQRDLLFAGAGFLIGIFIIKNAYLVFLNYIKLKFVFNKQVDVANRLFTNYMNAAYTFHLKRNSAELLRNVHAECQSVMQMVLLPVLTIIIECVMALAILVVLVIVEPVISLATFGFIVLASFILMFLTQKKMSLYGQLEVKLRKEKNKTVLQSLNAIKEIIVLGRKDFFLSEFANQVRQSSSAVQYKQFMSSIPKPFIETIAVAGVFLIVILMVGMGREMDEVIPLLALFGAAAIRFMPIFSNLVNNFNMLKFGVHSIDPVVNDLINLEHNKRQPTSEKLMQLQTNIIFEGIDFTYPGSDKRALKNVSLEIKKGEIIGLVGSSGAGKTTLVDLFLGVLKPTKGKIFVDGKDIWTNIESWQHKIGYVPQGIKLVDDTIANNIALGISEQNIDLNRVIEVAKMANLDTFIQTLDDKYQTVIGENGVLFSGGQRQRIGIARALYHEPEVLVLDEATSALDNITEKIITEAINNLRKNLTIVIIAHRLTTIKDSDKVYLMNNGELKAEGTYQELIENDIEFNKMSLND